ncbi:rhamnogalacturonan lyase family protein [Streptomyces sp. NPDC002143]
MKTVDATVDGTGDVLVAAEAGCPNHDGVVWPTSGNTALRISSTGDPSDIARPNLLEDRQYREVLAWQNTGYNQPPHPSFALTDD